MERALLENIAQTPGFKETFGDLGGVNLQNYLDDNEAQDAPGSSSIYCSSSESSLSRSSTPADQAEKDRKLWELLTSED
jgi:hypothetical protein